MGATDAIRGTPTMRGVGPAGVEPHPVGRAVPIHTASTFYDLDDLADPASVTPYARHGGNAWTTRVGGPGPDAR